MRLSEIASALKGQLIGKDALITSVGTDSRSIAKSQLFVALKGERFDGHDFALQALSQGAAGVLISQPLPVESGVLVDDTREALGKLASYWRHKFDIPLAAVTGSNGKTTVKEMLASILRAHAHAEVAALGPETLKEDPVLATQGNLNNDIGLPLTLLKLRQHHRYAVAEMGMNHLGEIRYLSHLAKPTVAMVNNASTAHLGELGSVENIARAKGEIFEGLINGGTAVINADDAYADFWTQLAAGRKILTFGINKAADVSANFELKADSSYIHLRTPNGDVAVNLKVAGMHNIRNALAAAAVASTMGASVECIAKGLEDFSGVSGRLQHKRGLRNALIIDDTYNANPASMKAAIDVLAAMGGKKLLVLGDMGELGEDARDMHFEIGQYAKQAGVNSLYTLGELSLAMNEAYSNPEQHYTTPEALGEALIPELGETTVVLVKGSRFMRMERVVKLITQEQQEEGGGH